MLRTRQGPLLQLLVMLPAYPANNVTSDCRVTMLCYQDVSAIACNHVIMCVVHFITLYTCKCHLCHQEVCLRPGVPEHVASHDAPLCALLQYLDLLGQRGREQDCVRQLLLGHLLGLVQVAARQAGKEGRQQHGEQLLLELQGGWCGCCLPLPCLSHDVVCLQLLYCSGCWH
jgi:hypothetical protein